MRQFFNYFKRLYGQPERLAQIGVWFALTIALEVTIPLVVGWIIDLLQAGSGTNIPAIIKRLFSPASGKEALFHNLIVLIGIYLLIITLRMFISYWRMVTCYLYRNTALLRLRDKFFSKIQDATMSWLQSNNTGDLVQRATTDMKEVGNFVTNGILAIVRQIAFLIITICIMLILDWHIALICVLLLPLELYLVYIFSVKLNALWQGYEEADSAIVNYLQQYFSGIRVVKAFGNQQFEEQNYEHLNSNLRQAEYKTILPSVMMGFCTALIQSTLDVSVLAYGLYRAANGEITLGELVVFMRYTYEVSENTRFLFFNLMNSVRIIVSMRRLDEVLIAEEEPDESALKQVHLQGNITFEHVDFCYPQSERQVLTDINLEIKAGETVGFFGATGSGKSTMLLLLQKLYQPSAGQIKFDGIPLDEIDRTCLRKQITINFQDAFIFSRPLADNIRLSYPEMSDEEVRHYAHLAQLDKEVERFTDGYQTMIGERGVTLSGGQKQRLAIARTLTRKSKIVAFDDSLSAVDMQTEQKLRQLINEESEKSTTIIVSHRVASLLNADKVVVFDHGRIVEVGTPQELIAGTGLFARIYDMQQKYAR